ncbi:hypothetical protein OH76DRAFT_1562308 [Lentinus brumalis]|uniref:Uncharacterized protein n=1 Tax=Lentinus brumalis TaxID=2498619 RepID=A0A371CHR5_9APHY|nr:hypothetical protein OH76DRAFT_1562308 [Polyporus brumalis]
MSRPLTLHVSALNDAEYTTYTNSIHDIVEADAAHAPDYDKLAVGVREARAWLRGRYPALAPSTLDSILRLFSPDLGPADVLTGGQFFAALRLVSHILGGREMDPSLVFIQGVCSYHASDPCATFHLLHETWDKLWAMGSFPPSSSARVLYYIIARVLL